MRKVLAYDISTILPYINWLYFYHAWGLSGKPKEDKQSMKSEALQMLNSWEGKWHTHAIFRLMEANGDGDDILIYDEGEGLNGGFEQNEHLPETVRIPMLRQQRPSGEGQPNLCLADFIRPIGGNQSSQGVKDKIGLFCTSVDGIILDEYHKDEYQNMLAQTLCDRLAEATAEKLHEDVRRIYWGYAPNEQITMEQTHQEQFQGIRPAVGYPSIPDTSVNFVLDKLLGMQEVGIRLTETGMMTPHACVSGFMFAHPQARYFEVGKVGEDQLRDYARRRGIPVEVIRKFLQSSLMRK